MKINNRNKRGQFATSKWYNKYDFKKAIFLALGITCFVVAMTIIAQIEVQKRYEQDQKERQELWKEGFEVGHFIGLTEGNENAKKDQEQEFFNNLSTNPSVSFLFQKYFPEQDIAKVMRAISLSESKGKQVQHFKLNKNGSWDCGFFQINTIHRNKGESMQAFCDRMNNNLEANFAMARKVYNDRHKIVGNGFTAWSDYNNGKYLKYIK